VALLLLLLLLVVVEIEPLVVVCCKPEDVVRNIEGGDNRCVRFPPREGDEDGVLILFFRNNAMILIFRFLGCCCLFLFIYELFVLLYRVHRVHSWCKHFIIVVVYTVLDLPLLGVPISAMLMVNMVNYILEKPRRCQLS
jgi:hypothetical protein